MRLGDPLSPGQVGIEDPLRSVADAKGAPTAVKAGARKDRMREHMGAGRGMAPGRTCDQRLFNVPVAPRRQAADPFDRPGGEDGRTPLCVFFGAKVPAFDSKGVKIRKPPPIRRRKPL